MRADGVHCRTTPVEVNSDPRWHKVHTVLIDTVHTQIQGVLKNCEILYTEDEIKKMSQFKFKKIVKEKIQEKVLVYLVKLQNKHTKSENLHLESKMHNYLSLSQEQSHLLTVFGTRVCGVRNTSTRLFNSQERQTTC